VVQRLRLGSIAGVVMQLLLAYVLDPGVMAVWLCIDNTPWLSLNGGCENDSAGTVTGVLSRP
jgi:hypothetical protein